MTWHVSVSSALTQKMPFGADAVASVGGLCVFDSLGKQASSVGLEDDIPNV